MSSSSDMFQHTKRSSSGGSSSLPCAQTGPSNANLDQDLIISQLSEPEQTQAIEDISANSIYQECSSACIPSRDEENCQLKQYPLNLVIDSIVFADYSVQIDGNSLITLHPIQSRTTIHHTIKMLCRVGGPLANSVPDVTPTLGLTRDLLTAANQYIRSAYPDLLKKNEPELCKERKLSDEDSKNTTVIKKEPESCKELSDEDSLNTTFIKKEPESYKEFSDEDSLNTTFIKNEPESYKELSDEDSLNTTFIKNEPESYKELSDEHSKNTTFIKKEPESYKKRTICDEDSKNTPAKKEEPGSSSNRKRTLYKISIQFDIECEIYCTAEVNEKTGYVSAVKVHNYKNQKITANELKKIRYFLLKKLLRQKGNVVHAWEDSVAKTFFQELRSELSSEFKKGKL